MNINKMTQKTQEAIQSAQSIAVKYGHVEVDGEHLLYALLTQEGGLVPRLVSRLDVEVKSLIAAIETELHKTPSVSGPGVEAGKIAAYALMGRDGYKEERDNIRSKLSANPKYRLSITSGDRLDSDDIIDMS